MMIWKSSRLLFCFYLLFFLTITPGYAQTICYTFSGINKDLLTNIQARLNIDERNPCIAFSSPALAEKNYRETREEIKKAIQPFGYFKPTIHGFLSRVQNPWQAMFIINPGVPVKISYLSVSVQGEGRNNKRIRNFMNEFPLKIGDVFDARVYENAKDRLFRIARNQGYVKAYFKNKVIINLQNNQAKVYFLLDTEDEYFFGPVTYSSDIYAKEFMDRIIILNQRDYFSSRSLIALQQDMESSYYFRQVVITPDFDHIKNHHIPIYVDYTVPKLHKYSFALGYGTLTGPRLKAGYSYRRITNTGHHFESNLVLSSVLMALTANYIIPGLNPLRDEWLIGMNAKHFNPKSGKSLSGTLTAGYTTKTKYTQYSINLNYLLERFTIYGFLPEKSHLLYPGLKINYLKADSLVAPQFGTALSFSLQGGSDRVLSTNSFLQPEVRGKFIYSPFDFAEIILRGDLGYLMVHDLSTFPFSLRYFAGGIDSIRGFADSSIGPGRFLTVGSIEYRNRIIGQWSGAVFYDAGIAANHFEGPVNQGAGVGIVYDTIIGPVKLYLAQAISKNTRPYSLEFSIGPELP